MASSKYLFGSLLLASVSVAMAQQYTARLITTPQGGFFSANSINDSTQVAGYYWTSGNIPRPAIWSPDGFLDLPAPTAGALALGLNASGTVVGYTSTNSGSGNFGVIWTPPTMSYIPPPTGFSWSSSGGIAVNDAGVVLGTGFYFDGAFESGLFLSSGGPPVFLSAPPGQDVRYATARALNNHSWVVGRSANHAIVWTPNPIDLNATIGGLGDARGLNNHGTVTGVIRPPGTSYGHAFLWNGTQITYLPDDGFSFANAINDDGVVVGRCRAGGAVWTANGLTVLNRAEVVAGFQSGDLLVPSAINNNGAILAGGTLKGVGGFYLLEPKATPPTLEVLVANRDDPFITWSSSSSVTIAPSPVYAGDGTGDLIAWRINNAPSNATFKWTAVQTAGLTHQTINGPEGAGNDTWSLNDGSFNWPPGTYQVTCMVTPQGGAATTLASQQIVGWRTQEYLVVGQVKPIHDYTVSAGRQTALVHALINSYRSRNDFLAQAARLALQNFSTEKNLYIWTAYQFLRYDATNGTGAPPEYVPLRGVATSEKLWMVQTMLDAFPDEVNLLSTLAQSDISNLISERSYRMYSRQQLRYLLSPGNTIDPKSVVQIRTAWDVGPTKFVKPTDLLSGTITVRGIELNLQGNSDQTFISGETSRDSGKLTVATDGTTISYYVAGRVGLEARVPNFALFARDAPFIFTEYITAIGPDGRDTNSRIRLSVDTTWTPDGAVTGNSHFNEIRIYARDYIDVFHRFNLVEGRLSIEGQLAPFLESGSPYWPGLPPPPSIY